jgi:hypothetical protein
MRKSLVIGSLLVLAFSAVAMAGIPAPDRSGFALSGKGFGSCHFVFIADGTGDMMTMNITLRDAFDTPVASCSTSATIVFNDDAGDAVDSICLCGETLVKVGVTDANGIVALSWDRFGGYGNIDVNVTAHCTGDIAIGTENRDFTTPDLDGSCEAVNSTGVVDLGVWAGGLGSNFPPSDYDCSGGINTVVDLGVWAGGLGKGCS